MDSNDKSYVTDENVNNRSEIRTLNTIEISGDKNVEGRTFEGIGAVSAGASTRLLPDYSPDKKDEILDYLFRPNFGASFHVLKVEIGGEVNSTCGTEPTHARSRDELDNPAPEYYNRGYEWDLMKGAKVRNSNILLSALAWGAAGWLGGSGTKNEKFFSKDTIDYMISFLKGAKNYHCLNIDILGIWNETWNHLIPEFNWSSVNWKQWIKDLKSAIAENGLNTIITAPDWATWDSDHSFEKEVLSDGTLNDSIHSICYHYIHAPAGGYDTLDLAGTLKKSDNITPIPLWYSEYGTWLDSNLRTQWERAADFAKIYNRNYALGKMTRTEIWSGLGAFYDYNPCARGTMLMANEPWSGRYEVFPAIWATAHTTQFAKPGWIYIDSGCGEYHGPNLAAGKTATASGSAEGYASQNVLDGSDGTRWMADGFNQTDGEWLEINFGQPVALNTFVIRQYGDNINEFKIQVWNDSSSSWENVVDFGQRKMGAPKRTYRIFNEGRRTVSKARVLITGVETGTVPSIYGLEVYNSEETYVTLKSPTPNGNGKYDYSIIIETSNLSAPKNFTVDLSDGLETGKVYVWHSNKAEQFIHSPDNDVTPSGGSCTITLQPGHIYSLTTTTGQSKGSHDPSVHHVAFPVPYSDDFESYAGGKTPKYFSDSIGTFAVDVDGRDGGKCLRQVLTESGIDWFVPGTITMTSIGDAGMADYEVSTDAYIETAAGDAMLYGRINGDFNKNGPDSYNLRLSKSGEWRLDFHDYPNWFFGDPAITTHASGTIKGFDGSSWHNMKLEFIGSMVYVFIDGTEVARYDGVTIGNGRCGLGTSSLCNIKFDNFKIALPSGRPFSAANTSFVTDILETCYDIRKDFTGYVGMKIHTGSSPLTVKELGRYWIQDNRGIHNLAIIDADTLDKLGSADIDMSRQDWGTMDYLGFVYTRLESPVILSADSDYYIVSFERDGGDIWFGGCDSLPGLANMSVASIIGPSYCENSQWNTETKMPGKSYGPVNFRY